LRIIQLHEILHAARNIGSFSTDTSRRNFSGEMRSRFFYQASGRQNWGNLMRYVRTKFEKQMLESPGPVPGAGDGSGDHAGEVAARSVAAAMKGKPWEEIEVVLEALHVAIAAKDPAWG
jgi:hypothetical protein